MDTHLYGTEEIYAVPDMTEIEGKTLDEVLDRAADVIDGRGWSTGHFVQSTGEVCVLGAIRAACYPEGLIIGCCKILREAISYVQRSLGETTAIAYWNDHICSGQGEATDLLRNEAKRWREENS